VLHLAYHDALTGLPNRERLRAALTDALDRGRRTGTATALLFIDLVAFKAINDAHGHDTGDQLLREVAGRLRLACEPTTCSPGTAATSSCCCSPTCPRAWRPGSPNGPPRTCWSASAQSSWSPTSRSASGRASGSAWPRPTPALQTSCCGTRTPRCTSPSAPPAASGRATPAPAEHGAQRGRGSASTIPVLYGLPPLASGSGDRPGRCSRGPASVTVTPTERDRMAELRDTAADERSDDVGGAAQVDRSASRDDRSQAGRDREAAAADRAFWTSRTDLSARSRRQAGDDPVDASVDRLVAGVDREDSLSDRNAAHLEGQER